MRFLHCSDVHVTTNYFARPKWELGWRRWIALFELGLGGRARDYLDAPSVLRRIVHDLARHRADHLIVSGDVTAYGMEEEFLGAREALLPVVEDKRRCTIIPGNHDTYTPVTVAARYFERQFGHLLDSDLPGLAKEGPYPFVRLVGEQAAVVGLCSARVPLMPGFSFGYVGKRQLEGLREVVNDERLKERALLVAVHHAPLAKSGGRDKPLHGLVDAEALMRLLPGPRFAVLHGHIHQRYHHPATTTRPHLFGAGSSTQKGKEGYWLIEVEAGRVKGGTMHVPGA
ncbi:MAG: metallophosphoesterase family protein [Myxococcota bacterium]